jgi:hypothetical protein
MKKIDLKNKLKVPKLSSGPANVKAPKFAADLYADLRDRRLLPLVALVIVAIAAVPFLLGSDEEPLSEAALTPAPAASPARASFSVVPADPGLRDYRQRLGDRPSLDPFSRPASPADTEGSSGGGEGSAEATGGEVAAGGSTGTEVTTTEVPPAGGGSGGSETTTDVVVKNEVIGYEIDTRAGFLGSVHSHHGLSPTTRLPSRKNPVVVFVGLSKDKERALFLMTSNVTAYYGKGRCAVDKQSCQLLELKPGKSATFAYGYGDARYKLILRKIVPVLDRHEVEATVTTHDGQDAASANGGATAGN